MGVSNHASEQCFETSALRDLDTVSKRQFHVCHPHREQPRRASCSCGMSCPVCLALEGFPVLFLCLAPEGSLNYPREIFLGGRRVPAGVARPRDEATAMKDHLPWPPELPAPSWPPELPAPPWPPELPAPPWPPELPASPWPPSSVPLWRSPSCGPVRVCPEGPPEHPPPLPGGTVTAWDTASGRGELCQGSVVCVSCVPASCVHIWFVSCPRQMWLLVNSCPGVFMSLSMIYLCIYSPVCSDRFCLVYSLLPVFPVCQPCLVLPCPH